MNDFGIFKALEGEVKRDDFLSERINEVVTELKPESSLPYLQVSFQESVVHLPCFIQTALVRMDASIVSDYHGEQQLQDLMSRFDSILDGTTLAVQIRALDLPGWATFKRVEQKIERDKGQRIGKIRYQVRVNVNRGNKHE